MTNAIALDLDGTITRFPEFFSTLSHAWPGDVYVITYRVDLAGAIVDCKKYNIRYTEVMLAPGDDDSKAQLIERLGITAFFDDMPEFTQHVSKRCATFHVRNEDNFDFTDKRYLFTKYTGKIVKQEDDESDFLTFMCGALPDLGRRADGDAGGGWEQMCTRLAFYLERVNGTKELT